MIDGRSSHIHKFRHKLGPTIKVQLFSSYASHSITRLDYHPLSDANKASSFHLIFATEDKYEAMYTIAFMKFNQEGD